MFARLIKIIGFTAMLSSPAAAQTFGVPQKRGGSFEELNEIAKENMGAADLADYANMDSDELMKLIQETMADPAMLEYVDGLGAGMGEAMEQLAKMGPEEIQQQMEENLKAMASPEMLNTILEQKDEVLKNLFEQGLITEEDMVDFQNDPQKFQEHMSQAFGEMTKILEDPDAIDAVTQVMKGVSDIMKDPSKAMSNLAQAFSEGLGDDDKIEEARLQLLSDPESAGNPALAALFQDEEMQDILKDPVKWREQVRKGQDMIENLADSDSDTVSDGAGVGEL